MYSLPLVSIIVPVYNGALYLERVIASVSNQTYEKIEMILVDDGSSDNSLDIINGFINTYKGEKRFKVVSQVNQGISSARNYGIEVSTGDYIVFIDQDDFVADNYIKQLVNEIESKASDIVIGGCYYFYEGKNKEEKHNLIGDYEWNLFRHTSPWARIYKASIIRENKIRFLDVKLSEDLYFNGVYLSYCKTYSFINQTGYRWVIRDDSESHKGMSNYAPDRDVVKVLSSMLKDKNCSGSIDTKLYEYLSIKHIAWYLLFIAPNTNIEILEKVKTDAYTWLRSEFPDYEKNPYLSISKPRGELLKIRIIVYIITTLQKYNKLMWFLKLYSKIA